MKNFRVLAVFLFFLSQHSAQAQLAPLSPSLLRDPIIQFKGIIPEIREGLRTADEKLMLEEEKLKRQRQTAEIAERRDDVEVARKNNQTAQAIINGQPPNTAEELLRSDETIKLLTRPVYGVCNGSVWTPQDKKIWNTWAPSMTPLSDKLSISAASVGLFQSYWKNDDSTLKFSGSGPTGFVVGPSHVMTNRHAISKYATFDGNKWHLKPERVLKIVFPNEYSQCKARRNPKEFEITEILDVGKDEGEGPSQDYAILQVKGTDLPESLTLSTEESLAEGTRVVALGYPGEPMPCSGNRGTPENPCTFLTQVQVESMFQLPDKVIPYSVLRISPGMVISNPIKPPSTFSYDASTWGGSSGSPIISLVDGTVIGLHHAGYAGDEYESGYNSAILAAKLRRILTANGVIK